MAGIRWCGGESDTDEGQSHYRHPRPTEEPYRVELASVGLYRFQETARCGKPTGVVDLLRVHRSGSYGVDENQDCAFGYEFDTADFNQGTPGHALIVATSNAIPGLIDETTMGTIAFYVSLSRPVERASITCSDIVFLETANGGAVFSSSSIAWNSSLWESDGSNEIAQITGKVIRRFLDPTPFPPLPGNDDLQDVDKRPGDMYYQNLLKNDGQSDTRQRINKGGLSDHTGLNAFPSMRNQLRLAFALCDQ